MKTPGDDASSRRPSLVRSASGSSSSLTSNVSASSFAAFRDYLCGPSADADELCPGERGNGRTTSQLLGAVAAGVVLAVLPFALRMLGTTAPPPFARPTNAVTDMALCSMHLVYLRRMLKAAPPTAAGRRLRAVAIAYLATICAWQTLSSWMHVYAPTQSVMSAGWFLYLAGGSAAPCLYGAALCLDQLPAQSARRAARRFAVAWAAYLAFAAGRLDVARVLPFLPATLRATLPPAVARAAAGAPWMGSALRAAGQEFAGEGALPLVLDGRGYAGVPFAEIFDEGHAGAFDLYAAFPCWRAHSLTFLFLLFGVGVNFVELGIALRAARAGGGSDAGPAGARRRGRAAWCARAHLGQSVALLGMPPVMVARGVGAGIDFMHLASWPGMWLQCRALEQAVEDAGGSAVAPPKKTA